MAWLQRVCEALLRPGGTEMFLVESNCDFSVTASAFPLFLTKEPNTHTLVPLVFSLFSPFFIFLFFVSTSPRYTKTCKLLHAAAMA